MDKNKTIALSAGVVLTGKKSRHRYEIMHYLGRGGFGITYLAKETVMIEGIPQTHKYTIKEFCMSDVCTRNADGSITVSDENLEDFKISKEEFRKEAEHLKEISHEGIVPVSEVFEHNNTIYYVMQFLGDTTLLKFIEQKGGSLDEDTALGITRKLAISLGYLHKHMMTHLDVKPDNIMIDYKDGSLRPILIDFGLCCHYGKNGEITAKVAAVGTSTGYSPMEQYVPGGVKSFTPQADIYALGATLFHMLTGHVPAISTEISMHYIYKHLPDDISESTSQAIVKAMQKDVEKRPKSMNDFLLMLNGNTTHSFSEEGNVTQHGTKKIVPRCFLHNYLYGTLCVIVVLALAVFLLLRGMKSNFFGATNHQTESVDSIDSGGQTIVNNDNTVSEEEQNDVQETDTGNQTDNSQGNNGGNTNSSNQPTTPPVMPEPIVNSHEKDLGYAVWYGSLVKGKPDGEGKMVFKRNHIIDSFDPDRHEAEIGDYVEGFYEDGHLVSGKWYDARGNKKQSIYIGGL